MLKYAKEVCKEKGMKEIIVGCYEDNLGSNKVIINNGGKLIRKETEEKELSKYWKIELKSNFYKIEL